MSVNNRLDELLALIYVGSVARSENHSLTVSVLVEAKQRMLTNTLITAIVSWFFLPVTRGTLRAIDVQVDTLVGCFWLQHVSLFRLSAVRDLPRPPR